MVDSTVVLKPGQRITDANGTPQSGATLEFFDAGTSNSRAVYSDSGLATSLGSTITCDAGGYPAASNVKVAIYTGTTAYKIVAKDSDGVTLWEHDNVLGAIDTSGFLTGNVTATTPVGTTASNKTFVVGDQGELWNMDCSGASLVATLPSAAIVGDGWRLGIRHNGTANVVSVRADGVETIKAIGHTSSAVTLLGLGETMWLVSDGAGWSIDTHVPPLITDDLRTISVEGRQSAPPGSPSAGQRWIVEGTPTGSWNTYDEHDVLEYDGIGNWIQYNPADDCGWLAYIKDENLTVQYTGTVWQDWNNVTKAIAVLHVQERQADGIDAGTFTAGSYDIRVLNTVASNSVSGSSLASNQVTLPAGTYEVRGFAPAYFVGRHKAILYNVTDSSTELIGIPVAGNADATITLSIVTGEIVLTEEKVFELRHQTSSTRSSDGLGKAANFGDAEVYSDLTFRKVA